MLNVAEMTVLLVDDMQVMCKSIRNMLRVLGYGKTFHVAHNGLEALNLLKKEPIDLAVIDWNMPVMNGVELLARIREDSKLRDMPVVMVTAEANREIVAQAAESDIDAYILKPITAKALQSRIIKVIDRANNPPPMIHHLRKARDYEEIGDLDAAIKEVDLAIEADPSSQGGREECKGYRNQGPSCKDLYPSEPDDPC